MWVCIVTAMLSSRYSFGERVYDATHDEHNNCLGLSQVAVIVADYHLETIEVWRFESLGLAHAWRAADDESLPDIEYYTVGGDIR